MTCKIIVEDNEGSWVLCVHPDRTWDMRQHRIQGESRDICSGRIEEDGSVVGSKPTCNYPALLLNRAKSMLAIVCG